MVGAKRNILCSATVGGFGIPEPPAAQFPGAAPFAAAVRSWDPHASSVDWPITRCHWA